MFNTTTPSISYLLENVGIALDITEAQYKEVVNRYTAVSNHLSQEGSALSRYKTARVISFGHNDTSFN